MGTQLFDKYSLMHMTMGGVMFFLGFGWPTTLILHTLFELVENTVYVGYLIQTYLWWWPGGKAKPDNARNIIGDTISVMLGWFIGYYATN